MENVFNYAVRRIREEIEEEILQSAFGGYTKDDYFNLALPLDACIKSAVLENSVVKDISLISGTEVSIPLAGLPIHRVNDTTSAVTVPSQRRGGRQILEVYRVTHTTGFNQGMEDFVRSSSEVSSSASRVLMAMTTVPTTGTTRCKIISPNTFTFELGMEQTTNLTATVSVASDDKLSHIPPKAFSIFGDLVVAKAKQLIFIKLNVLMGDTVVRNGKEVGVFSDRVREWSDARETYNDILKRWRRIEVMINPVKMEAQIRQRMGRIK